MSFRFRSDSEMKPNLPTAGQRRSSVVVGTVRYRPGVPERGRSSATHNVRLSSTPLWLLILLSLLFAHCILGAQQSDEVEQGGSLSPFLKTRLNFAGSFEQVRFFESHTTNQTLLLVIGTAMIDRQ